MRIIQLTPKGWKSISDFYEALLLALGAPDWHGRNINALIDSMIYGGINEVDPPYTIRIVGSSFLPKALRREIKWDIDAIEKARDQAYAPDGGDVQIAFDTDL